jgi:hypothetical protein
VVQAEPAVLPVGSEAEEAEEAELQVSRQLKIPIMEQPEAQVVYLETEAAMAVHSMLQLVSEPEEAAEAAEAEAVF